MRGGLTKPKFYQWMGESEYGFAEWGGGTVSCNSEVTDGPYDEHHYWDWGGSWGYRGTWGGDYTELEEFESADLADETGEQLQEIWKDIAHGEFSPHALWKHIKDVELPNLGRSIAKAQGTIWEHTPAYTVEEHLRQLAEQRDPEANDGLKLYRRILLNSWKADDSRLGVRFYDSDENLGYCPICGGTLAFYPDIR